MTTLFFAIALIDSTSFAGAYVRRQIETYNDVGVLANFEDNKGYFIIRFDFSTSKLFIQQFQLFRRYRHYRYYSQLH